MRTLQVNSWVIVDIAPSDCCEVVMTRWSVTTIDLPRLREASLALGSLAHHMAGQQDFALFERY